MRHLFPRVSGPRRFLIYVRFVRYLIWEFRWPLLVFAFLVIGGGILLSRYYHTGGVNLSIAKACHAVFLMIFLESSLEFPSEWYLQPLFFLLPIVGLGAIADSLIRMGYLMFSRKQNLPEWNRMVASLCRNHIIVVGVGKVGYQVLRGLLELRETVVAIETKTDASFLNELYQKDIPVIQGNARTASILEQAGIRSAKGVIITTSDDLTNLDVAMTARDLSADARIVIRLFDETLARKVAGAFAMPTISTSQVAAPAFIAAATGRKVYQRFQVAGQEVHLTDLNIEPGGKLAGQSIGAIQSSHKINVVMRQSAAGVELNPAPITILNAGDIILVIAPMGALLEIEALNQRKDG